MARRKTKNLELEAFEALQNLTHTISPEVYKRVAKRPLTASQFRALKALYSQGPMFQFQLVPYTFNTQGNITMVIDKLEKSGLVERKACKADRRAYEIHLTQEGEKLITKLNKTYLSKVKKEMGIFSEKELSEIIKLGTKIEPQKINPSPFFQRK